MTLFDEYRAHGWQVCDIPPGTKGPTSVGWNLRGAQPHGQRGLGLCHAYSGTCAVDVDDYPVAIDWLHKQGIDLDALLEDTKSVQIISGKVNRAKLLYKLSTPLPSLSLAPYERLSAKTGKMQTFHALELRCAARNGTTMQDVLPPTVHPETLKPYTWGYGDETFGHWSNLSELPSAILALWTAQVSLSPPEAKTPQAPKGASLAEVVKLLAQTDPNGYAYDDWLKVGMAVHHETGGSTAGYDLWCEWSARCHKHDTAHMPAKWRSFDATEKNPVTLGSLRRQEIAAPADFETLAMPDVGVDTRPSSAMQTLLEDRLVFIKRQALYYDLQDNCDTFLTDRAIQHLFCPFVPDVMVPGKNGKPDKMIRPDPVQHLKNSKTKKVADQIGVHPGAGRLYREDDTLFANRYAPLNIEPLMPRADEKEAMAFLWSRMADPAMQVWMSQFYSYALQKPGVKIQSAPLLYSEETGSGKNTIAKLIPEILFGSRWVRGMSGDVLGGTFSDVIGETWWLYLEELRSGSTKIERVAVANKIKTWVTDPRMTVHPKGLKPYDARNRLQLTATSNFADAIHIDNNDRRWAIIQMLGAMSEKEAMELYSFLLSDRAPGVLRHMFMAVDIRGFNPAARAPMSDAKKAMINAGVSLWESRLIERCVALEPPFDRDLFRLKDVQEQVMGLQAMSAQALGGMLKKRPFNFEQLKGATGIVWCWRNAIAWRGAPETARTRHMETGARPAKGYWSLSIPATIVAMSADGGVDSPNADLLG